MFYWSLVALLGRINKGKGWNHVRNEFIVDVIVDVGIVKAIVRMHSSVKRQSLPLSLVNLSYNKVYHKQDVAMFCIY